MSAAAPCRAARRSFRSLIPVLSAERKIERLARAILFTSALVLAPAAAAARPPLVAAGKLTPAVSPAASESGRAARSAAASRVLDWIVASGDNLDLPFIIVDKVHAQVLAFDADGAPLGSAPALIGLGRGDLSPPGIGQRKLAEIAPAERITPAGRFLASLGNDLGKADILWVDYASAISLHRVVPGSSKERRLHRLATPSTADNRISYGCINVPVQFFDSVVGPAFQGTNGIVYVLPEATPLGEVFDLPKTEPPSELLSEGCSKPGKSGCRAPGLTAGKRLP